MLTSTVLPGAMRHGLLPILEQHAGKKGGAGFGVCYSPEFIALGSVIRDFLNPDFLLIGELDARVGRASRGVLCATSWAPATPVRRMTLENAELAKISVNAFVTTKITFANMLAEMCGAIPGGDVDVVSDAIGMDSRIGRKYLTGGLGFGGPCFPRDNVALGFIADALGAPRAICSTTTDRLNRSLADRILDELRSRVSREVDGGGARSGLQAVLARHRGIAGDDDGEGVPRARRPGAGLRSAGRRERRPGARRPRADHGQRRAIACATRTWC